MKIIIKGNSMEPTLYEGETYHILPIRCRVPLKIGDIVVAEIDHKIVVKRIVKYHNTIFGCSVYDLYGDNRFASKNFTCVSPSNIKYIVGRPTVFTKLMRRWRNASKR